MPRDHVEFVQIQHLPNSTTLTSNCLNSRLRGKVLSRDDHTGAASELIFLPPGYDHVGDVAVDRDQELFVIEGTLTLDGSHVHAMDHAWIPAGDMRARMSAPQGATVLSFWGPERTPRPLSRAITSSNALPWLAEADGHFAPGAARKELWTDPETGEPTFLLGTLPLRENTYAQKHPVVEEMFLLAGELIGPNGVMLPGAYFWRPPEIWHGPFAQRAGCLMLIRGVGGPLTKVHADEPSVVDWEPEHAPILPTGTPRPAQAPLDSALARPFISFQNETITSATADGR